MKNAEMVVDLQFGSTGKGLIAGYLAEKNGYDTVVNANMPNAGHTYINASGREWIHKVLPNGIVSPNLKMVMIGPGSVFSEDRMLQEILASKDLLKGKDIFIHENAVVLSAEHANQEQKLMTGISSTMQGSAAAMIQKIWRQAQENPCIGANGMDIKGDLYDHVEIVRSNDWNEILRETDNVLIEGAQGYSLGINAGFYPYCTSRDCTPARFLADCQIPHTKLSKVIGTARVHPIRVGSLPGSTSGGHYPDQEEISWDEIGVNAETTTVTGRKRRVFTFSWIQLEHAVMMCQPNEVFLNFCNYDEMHAQALSEEIENILEELGPKNSKVKYMGWGPSFSDVKERISFR